MGAIKIVKYIVYKVYLQTFSPNALHFTKERSDMISFYENFHNINKISAIFVSSALRRVELVLFSCAPLPYAIRTPRNIHVVTEGEKTTSLPSK